MADSKRGKFLQRILQIIFVIYIFLLLRFTLFKYAPLTRLWDAFFLRNREYSIIPFRATYGMIRGLSPLRLIENLAGNIILFVPFGILLPLALGIKRKTILFGCLASCMIEILQFVFAMGTSDIDDIILNTLGTVFGYVIYIIAKHIFMERKTLLTAAAIVLGTGLAAGILVLYAAGYLMDGFPNITF